MLADFAFQLLQLELEFADFAAQVFSISHFRPEDLALGNLSAVGLLQALKLFALCRGPVVREVLRADKQIQFLSKLARDVGFHLRVGATRCPFGQRRGIGLCAIAHANDMDDRFAVGDFLLDHLANTAVIGRKIRLLDRHAAHRQERLFHEFSRRAQILGRGGNEHSGRAFRRNRSSSTHGIE